MPSVPSSSSAILLSGPNADRLKSTPAARAHTSPSRSLSSVASILCAGMALSASLSASSVSTTPSRIASAQLSVAAALRSAPSAAARTRAESEDKQLRSKDTPPASTSACRVRSFS
eukprot:6184142-Pleurochrysis_carterae.AAC.2